MEPQRVSNPDDWETRRCASCARTAVTDAMVVWEIHEQTDAAEAVHVAREAVRSGLGDAAIVAFAAITGAEKVAEIAALGRAIEADAPRSERSVISAHARRYLGGRVRATPAVAAEVFLGDIIDDCEHAPTPFAGAFEELWNDIDGMDEATAVDRAQSAARDALAAACPDGSCRY